MRPKSRGNSFRFWGIWGRVFHRKLYKANCWKTFPWLSVHKNSKRSKSPVKKEMFYKQPECFWAFFFLNNIILFPIFATFQYSFRIVQPKCSWTFWLFFLFFWNISIQVQAIGMYGAAQPDFFKSETTWDIKIITTHHLYIYKSCVFTQNLEGVTPKISLPRPWEVWNGQGRGSVIFQDTLFKFCGKLSFHEILNW